MPDTVQFRNGNQIINYYAADGRKMGTRYFTLTNPIVVPMGETRQWQFEDMVVDETTTYNADNFEYTPYKDPDPDTQSDWISLTRINNVEGYVSRVPLAASATNQPTYCYYRKDHLGNNREVWQAPVEGKDKTTAASTIQRTQYYPSGLPFCSLTNDNPERQPYKYNGKEFITMLGYDIYDYGMRGYYPAIMRFTTPDPLAEKYYSISPYAYCLNNPLRFVDLDGGKVVFVNGYLGFGSPEGGRNYWSNSFVAGAQFYFGDNNVPYFTYVKHGKLSTSFWRHGKGYDYAKSNYIDLIRGMEEGETFKLVSHSMGGAFSTGMQQYLEEQGWTIESSVFINTYQSDNIKTKPDNSSTFVVDFQNTNDPVLFWMDTNLGKGEIKNSDVKIRVKSDKDSQYVHKGPISDGQKFWDDLFETIQRILNK